MKKLLLVLVVASFIGLAFAYAPVNVSNDYTQSEISLLEDTIKTTKTKKKTEDCPKKHCCKKKCDKSKTKKDKKKKND